MLISEEQDTIFEWDEKEFKMEYELRTLGEKELMGSGRIYLKGEDEDPLEFTFATTNGEVNIYTPMNGTKEFIGAIVEKVTGKKMPVGSAF